jgi:hypothetical protein
LNEAQDTFWRNQLKCVAADNDKNVTGLAEQLYKVCERGGYSEGCTALFISKLFEETKFVSCYEHSELHGEFYSLKLK